MTKFVQFTKHTDDPKLAYMEHRLTEAGIPHRRNGHSFHAPIMEVAEDKYDAAEDILLEKWGDEYFDDIPEDHPEFIGYEPHDFIPSEKEAE